MSRRVLTGALLVYALAACGDAPLESIGLRSSDWINEPTVPTTVVVETTQPVTVPVISLQWSNDGIVTENLGDYEALLAEVFERREGDSFIQASRAEIVAALPDIAFPDRAPNAAQWVSSQLVFENEGVLSDDPAAAFGVWSAEPYTRSRSVAQMIVIRVATEAGVASDLAAGAVEASCARFSDRGSDSCEITTVGDRDTWLLDDTDGSTVIWYEGDYRYEMYGRSFVPEPVIFEMSGAMVPLAGIGAEAS